VRTVKYVKPLSRPMAPPEVKVVETQRVLVRAGARGLATTALLLACQASGG
jgi:hypothetical protein